MPPEQVIAVLGGTIGTLVSVIVIAARMHLADDARRDTERDKREAQLTSERDAWQHRWESADGRLDRVSNAFVTAVKQPAPE